jgi:hypothetical protein
LQALLRRSLQRLVEASVLLGVGLVGDERRLEVEAAGAEDLLQRLEARLDDVAFPAGELRAVLAAATRELDLRQAGTKARFPDERAARHGESVTA